MTTRMVLEEQPWVYTRNFKAVASKEGKPSGKAALNYSTKGFCTK